jgi:hypothetical protein
LETRPPTEAASDVTGNDDFQPGFILLQFSIMRLI